MIDRVQWSTGAAVGSAGAATATGYSVPVQGLVVAVHVAYVDSPPAATTDFTLSDEDDPSSESIVSISNAATDTKLYPRRAAEDNTGSALQYDSTDVVFSPYVVHGRLEATIAQANAGDSVTVTAWIER